MKKAGFYIIKDKFLKIYRIQTSRTVKMETDPTTENNLMLTSEHVVKEIEDKAKKEMGMLKRGVKFTPTQLNVMAILEKL